MVANDLGSHPIKSNEKIHSNSTIYNKNENIIKSQNDDRLYRYLYLNNEIEILIISDKDTEKSAAAVDVNVGFLLDPEEVPGIAHFCEHMLFLGTEKYPVENGFNEYLSANGGRSNAYTSNEHTNYFFDIKNEMLEGALDRFAQFFISPLFNADATERELNAIESEFQKNELADTRRIDYVNKYTSRKNHVYRKFGSGNLETLKTIPTKKDINIRELLLKFHKEYYSSNIIKVVLVGRESLDSLESIVVPLFEAVPNKKVALPKIIEHPFGKDELGVEIKIKTVKEMKKLQLIFPLPDIHQYYREKPLHYLSHLIGHEGKGSLLSLLKKKAWVNTLAAGPDSGAKGEYSFFTIGMELNEDGLNHVSEIISMVFQYIKLLTIEGPKEWIYQEEKMLNEIAFRFKDKEHQPSSYVSNLARSMQNYPAEDIIYGQYRYDNFNMDLITQMQDMLNPNNFRYIIASQSLDNLELKVPHYKAEYSIKRIDPADIKSWLNADLHPELSLPSKNIFIPNDLDFKFPKEEKEVKGVPILIKDTDMVRIWYKADDTFFLPKSCVRMLIKCPLANSSPFNLTQLEIFLYLLKDALNEYAYDAEVAGVDYSVNATKIGIIIQISGYSDKQITLLVKIFEKLVSLDIKEDRYAVAIEMTEEALRNVEKQQPYSQLSEYMYYLLAEGEWSTEEQLEALSDITFDSLKCFCEIFMKNLYIEALICGNITLVEAHSIITETEKILIEEKKAKRLFPIEHMKHRECHLTEGCSYLFEKRNSVHAMSCIQVYFQVGLQEAKMNVLSELFSAISKEPCFDTLRTKEQLGYIVASGGARTSSAHGFSVMIQSDRPPSVLEERIDSFLLGFEKYLTEMTAEKFQLFVDALTVRKLEKPKRLRQEVTRFYTEIVMKQYHFRRAIHEVEKLKEISKEELIAYYNTYISPKSKKRKKLTMILLGKEAKSLLDDEKSIQQNWIVIDDILKFKSSMPLYPLLLPYNDIPLVASSAKSKL